MRDKQPRKRPKGSGLSSTPALPQTWGCLSSEPQSSGPHTSCIALDYVSTFLGPTVRTLTSSLYTPGQSTKYFLNHQILSLCSEPSAAPITLRIEAQLLGLLIFSDTKGPRFPKCCGCVAPPSLCTCGPLACNIFPHPIMLAVRNGTRPREPPLSGHMVLSCRALRRPSFEASGFRDGGRGKDRGVQHPPAPGPSARRLPSAPADWGGRGGGE